VLRKPVKPAALRALLGALLATARPAGARPVPSTGPRDGAVAETETSLGADDAR
jgi:hypothetical protein